MARTASCPDRAHSLKKGELEATYIAEKGSLNFNLKGQNQVKKLI